MGGERQLLGTVYGKDKHKPEQPVAQNKAVATQGSRANKENHGAKPACRAASKAQKKRPSAADEVLSRYASLSLQPVHVASKPGQDTDNTGCQTEIITSNEGEPKALPEVILALTARQVRV